MARKFLQMGYTRSRRYANHKLGHKYQQGTKTIIPREEDLVKAESAKIFYDVWQIVKTDPDYLSIRDRHLRLYGDSPKETLRERELPLRLQSPRLRPYNR